MDQELRQRATVFARVLAATTTQQTEDSSDPSNEEFEWFASGLAFSWLERAVFWKEPLRAKEASKLLKPGAFDELAKQHLVRNVLGRVNTVSSGDLRRRAVKSEPDLQTIIDATREPGRGDLWIGERAARKAHAIHSRSNPKTPPWGSPAMLDAIEPRDRKNRPGYILRAHRGDSNWLQRAAAQGAAKLWVTRLPTAHQRDEEALRDWLDSLPSLDIAIDAVRCIPKDSKKRLFAAALRLVEHEPNYGDLSSELVDAPESDKTLVPRTTTSAAHHLFWKEVSWEPFDEARMNLLVLVAMILNNDSLKLPPHVGGNEEVIALAILGAQRPRLVFDLMLQLNANHSDAIAWLLTRPSCAALGLLLLAGVPIQEQTMMDSSTARDERLFIRRTALFTEALPIFCRCLTHADPKPEDSTLVEALLDTMRGFALQIKRTSQYYESQPIEVARANAFFRQVVHAIATTRSARISASTSADSARLLIEDHAILLVRKAPDHFPANEPDVRAKVDLELLRIFRERGNRVLDDGSARALVERLLTDYGTLSGSAVGSDSFIFDIRNPWFLDFDWAHFACAALENGVLAKWTSLPGMRARILAANDSSATATSKAFISSCIARLRDHLHVLLKTHADNRTHVLASAEVRRGVRDHLEIAVESFVLAKTDVSLGTLNLFDEELSYSFRDGELAALVEITAKTLEHFQEPLRDRIFETWISSSRAINVLLAIERHAPTLGIARRVQARLADNEVLEAVTEGAIVRVMELVERAAEAGHTEIVGRLLQRGDKIMERHPWRPEWETKAFRARLLLFYRKRDRNSIRDLPAPASTKIVVQDRLTLEDERSFFLALVDMEEQPAAAEASFRALAQREPESSTLLINLFAAKLRIAKALPTAPEREEAHRNALNWWDRAVASFPDPGRFFPTGKVNEFLALDGALLDDEFERRWSRLDDDQRRQLDLVYVRLQNLTRRGLTDEVRRLVTLAKNQHGPAALEKLDVQDSAEASLVPILPSQASVADHQRIWGDIKRRPPTEFSQVLGRGELQDYVRHMHVNACEQVLRYFPTIHTLGSEDRISDFIVSYVAMQTDVHEWTAPTQARGGLANTDLALEEGTPGNRDWIISQGTRDIAICEAMRLNSATESTIHEHIQKLVERYDPTGVRASLVLVYFEGKDFKRFAEKYRSLVKAVPLSERAIEVGEWFDLGKTQIVTFRALIKGGGEVTTQDHLLVKNATSGRDQEAMSDPPIHIKDAPSRIRLEHYKRERRNSLIALGVILCVVGGIGYAAYALLTK